MPRERVQTRVPEALKDRIDTYQSEYHMNQAEAIRSLLRAGLDAEEESEDRDELDTAVEEATKDARDSSPEIAPDGGYLRLSDHPWIDPLIKFAADTIRISIYSLFISMIAILVPGGAIDWFGADLSAETYALFLSLFTIGVLAGTVMLIASLTALLILEYLMHPTEAPFRRYFYEKSPDIEGVVA